MILAIQWVLKISILSRMKKSLLASFEHFAFYKTIVNFLNGSSVYKQLSYKKYGVNDIEI